MDPITHALVGLAAGSFSGSSNVLANPLALGCLIGSVIPDGDIVLQYWGDFVYLKNHRGVSHSIPVMAGLSAIAALLINAIFPGNAFWSIFLWTFIGCLTHIVLDVFNSFGAKVLWPFYDKKVGTGLLLVFDPLVVVIAALVYWFNKNNLLYTGLSIGIFILYLLFRQFSKIRIYNILVKEISVDVNRIVLLPSMSGLFNWDFIAYGDKVILTGKINAIGRKIEFRDKLEISEDWINELVMDTKIGQFFKDFSHECYISCEDRDDLYYVTLTDLRYYMKDRYMHHGTVLFNKELELVECAFHPYHNERNSRMPI